MTLSPRRSDILDYAQSAGDGLSFLIERSRRNLLPAVPVAMITADSSDPHLLQAMAAGAQGYIEKPFTLAEIQARVATLLSSTSQGTREMIEGAL